MGICCIEVIEPSIKLSKMLTLLKALIFFQLPLVFLDIFLFKTTFYIRFLSQLPVIFLGICTKNYGNFLMGVLVYLIFFITFIESVIAKFKEGINTGKNPVTFCYRVFASVFEFFCTFYLFQIYKQSKHEMRIKLGFIPDDREQIQIDEDNNRFNNNEEDNVDNNNNNNQDEFQPFQGHGVVVGGGGDNNQ